MFLKHIYTCAYIYMKTDRFLRLFPMTEQSQLLLRGQSYALVCNTAPDKGLALACPCLISIMDLVLDEK